MRGGRTQTRVIAAVLVCIALATAGCLGSDPGAADEGVTDAPASASVHRALVHPSDFQGEPSLGVAPDGTLYTQTREGVHRSTDDGDTWEAMGPATIGGQPGIDPHVTVDADGVVWFSSMNSAGCLEVDVSTDGGGTWEQHPAVCDLVPGDRQFVVATGNGRAYLAYHQQPVAPAVLETTDLGASWTTVHRGDPADQAAGTYTSWFGDGILNDATGAIHFPATVWTECREPDPTCLEDPVRSWAPGAITRPPGATEWQRVLGPESGGDAIGLGLVRADADDRGVLYVTWASLVDGDVALWLASSPDDGASWTAAQRIDTGSGSEVFPSVAADGTGRVAVAAYAADEAGHPSELSDDAQWTVRLYEIDASDPEIVGAVHERELSNGTVKTGRIAVSGTAASVGDREFLDYFALEHLPDGRWVSVYNTLDPDTGEQHNVFARVDA